MESFPDEDVMKTVKMTAKDLEYYTNLVDKAVSGFGRIDLRFDRDSTVGKMLSNHIVCYREIIHERKSQLMCQNFIVLGNCHQIRSDQISRSVVSDSLRPHELQYARPPCPSPTPGVHSDSYP